MVGTAMPDYLTTDEVAEILGYHVKSVRRLVRDGKLGAVKKGVWLIPREALEVYQQAIKGLSKHDPRRGR
jgi:excisionase family DNA binding protein